MNPELRNHFNSVIILGAGLAGAGTALELASRGFDVTLVDQDVRPINRASLRNEGKIHLGLCYANDLTMETATLQLRGALSFRRILSTWIGERANGFHLSNPFVYAIAHSSLLDEVELTRRYTAIESIYRDLLQTDHRLDYFGRRPERLFSRIHEDDLHPTFSRDQVKAGFLTEELAIDAVELAVCIRAAVAASPRISFLPNVWVDHVARTSDGFRIEGKRGSVPWSIDGEQVVNSTWDGRLKLDQEMGVLQNGDWLHRLKYRVLVKLPDAMLDMPSVTMVVGRYGDVVIRKNGYSYLSWYPAGLQGWTHDISPPASWQAPCRGEVEAASAAEIAKKIVGGIENWYPGVGNAEICVVDAGAIVARGKKDVDEVESELHTRTVIGVSSFDGYHSLDPGKLTTAPLFACTTADRVEQYAGRMPSGSEI